MSRIYLKLLTMSIFALMLRICHLLLATRHHHTNNLAILPTTALAAQHPSKNFPKFSCSRPLLYCLPNPSSVENSRPPVLDSVGSHERRADWLIRFHPTMHRMRHAPGVKMDAWRVRWRQDRDCGSGFRFKVPCSRYYHLLGYILYQYYVA